MRFRKLGAIALALAMVAPASAQTYDANQNIKTAAPSIVQTATLTAACATPATPQSCVASGGAVIYSLLPGYSAYGVQLSPAAAANGGVYAVETSIDCVNFIASNVEIAGGSPSGLAYATSFSAAGKYSGLGGTNACLAIVATTAPSASTALAVLLGSHDAGTVVRATVPLSAANLAVGLAAFAPNQVTVTTTAATQIVAARPGATGVGRGSVTIFNNSTVTVYLGGSGVTSSNGLPLPANAAVTLPTTAAIYGALAASGSALLGYYELY